MLRRQLVLETLECRYLLAANISALNSSQDAVSIKIDDQFIPTEIDVDIEAFAFNDYDQPTPFPFSKDFWAVAVIEGSLLGQANVLVDTNSTLATLAQADDQGHAAGDIFQASTHIVIEGNAHGQFSIDTETSGDLAADPNCPVCVDPHPYIDYAAEAEFEGQFAVFGSFIIDIRLETGESDLNLASADGLDVKGNLIYSNVQVESDGAIVWTEATATTFAEYLYRIPMNPTPSLDVGAYLYADELVTTSSSQTSLTLQSALFQIDAGSPDGTSVTDHSQETLIIFRSDAEDEPLVAIDVVIQDETVGFIYAPNTFQYDFFQMIPADSFVLIAWPSDSINYDTPARADAIDLFFATEENFLTELV